MSSDVKLLLIEACASRCLRQACITGHCVRHELAFRLSRAFIASSAHIVDTLYSRLVFSRPSNGHASQSNVVYGSRNKVHFLS